MRAVVADNGRLIVRDYSEPVPEAGEILVAVRACGICGSDLHTLAHGDEVASLGEALGSDTGFDPALPYVLGHEFCGEVLDAGAETFGFEAGDLVVSMPFLLRPSGLVPLGFANAAPGGYAERMVLTGGICLKVPNGLDHRRAALTEPMAVALHAVNKSGIKEGDAAVIVGCGPIGLAMIPWLRLRGIEPIVAADFSAKRRALALELGADLAVDPRDEAVTDAWRRVDGAKELVIFEAVGTPGMIDSVVSMAPSRARLLIAGVCMPPDTFRPFVAIVKELSMQFVYCYDGDEFAATLRAIAEGEVVVDSLITGTVGFDGVSEAFRLLGDPEDHVKILIEPGSGPEVLHVST
jgi:2-desacetyl-2-hydroxyethyl bacteriochlorophyllide A dehydrogenase